MVDRFSNPALRAFLVGVLVGIAGCTSASVKTYPVRGNVVLSGGDAKLLTGSFVEFVLESDPLVRSSGKITPEGKFTLETIHGGQVLNGAREGAYKAQIILAPEDDEGVPKGRGNPIHSRFSDYKTSGLSFTVPTQGEVTISLSKS